MASRSFLLLCALLLSDSAVADAPRSFELKLRSQRANESGGYYNVMDSQTWAGQETAVIVCDMWDSHHCYRAVQRANEMSERMNRFLAVAREAGATIIHAPSGCMDAYKAHAARRRAYTQPRLTDQPAEIDQWCYSIASEETASYPLDQTGGGEDDTPEEHAAWEKQLVAEGRDPKQPWRKQMDSLQIDSELDFISDRGDEIWAILANRKIDNVMLVGVHLNMCVLGRPFGLRQMSKNGKNVVLVSDLTDTMYDPAKRPFVSHFTGTDLMVAHVQRHVCPTITSDQVIGGKTFTFAADKRPTVVMLIGESEYQTETSLRRFAVEQLGQDFRVRFVVPTKNDPNDFPDAEWIDNADALLISVRRRTLPPSQLERVRNFAESDRGIVGIRTASHAFSLRKQTPPEGRVEWPEFDAQVFGGNYTNHHGNRLESMIHFTSAAQDHPITAGLRRSPFAQGGSLYRTSPLKDGATVLLVGRAEGVPEEPVAWTFQRDSGGPSFYTSLGHVQDFEKDVFAGLLKQSIRWAVRRGQPEPQ